MAKVGTKNKAQIEHQRKPIVDKCKGWAEETDEKGKVTKSFAPDCSKIYTDENNIQFCISYLNPEAIQRRGCALGDNTSEEQKKQGMTLQRKFGKKRRNR